MNITVEEGRKVEMGMDEGGDKELYYYYIGFQTKILSLRFESQFIYLQLFYFRYCGCGTIGQQSRRYGMELLFSSLIPRPLPPFHF